MRKFLGAMATRKRTQTTGKARAGFPPGPWLYSDTNSPQRPSSTLLHEVESYGFLWGEEIGLMENILKLADISWPAEGYRPGAVVEGYVDD